MLTNSLLKAPPEGLVDLPGKVGGPKNHDNGGLFALFGGSASNSVHLDQQL